MTALLRSASALLLLGLLAPSASAQGALTLPARVNGELTRQSERVELTLADAVRPADRYTFTLASGQRATVRMESTAFDTYLKAFRNGSFDSRNDDHQGSREVSQIVLTTPGDYTVWAGAFSESNNTGSYTLSVMTSGGGATTSPPSNPPPGGRTLQIPGRIQGQLTSSSERVELTIANAVRAADRYTFRLDGGQQATVRMESAAFDTYLKIFRNGEYHARNDDHDGSRDVSQVSLSSPGEYTVLAGTFTETLGAYELAVSVDGQSGPVTPAADPPSSQDPPAGDGGVITGTLTADDARHGSRTADLFQVEMYAGETLVLTLESQDFDTYLILLRDGETVISNDDAGSTSRSEIRYRIPSDGTYRIAVTGYGSDARGAYTYTWAVE